MSDHNETAARLYGTTAPDPAAVAAAAPDEPARHPDQARADRMFRIEPPPEARTDIPKEVAAMRAADPARQMFGSKAFEQDLPDGSLPGIDVVEARQVALDLGAEAVDLRELRTLANAEAEPDVEAWRVESNAMLTQRGFTAADLDGARQLVRRDPRVLAYLDATGLGDHPKVVARFVELARRARANGTLKAKSR